jgi:hypothetical protein
VTMIRVMRSSVSAESAMRRVAGLLDAEAAIERRVFYPWYHFNATGCLRSLFGRRRIEIDCLVDARSGRAASADALTLDRVLPAAGETLDAQQDIEASRRKAERYASHALGRRFRLLGRFDLRLDEPRLVHRPYWIVRAGAERVLLDAVTGEVHPLAADHTM